MMTAILAMLLLNVVGVVLGFILAFQEHALAINLWVRVGVVIGAIGLAGQAVRELQWLVTGRSMAAGLLPFDAITNVGFVIIMVALLMLANGRWRSKLRDI